LKLNGVENVTLHQAALTPEPGLMVELYRNGGKNQGNHSLLAKRGRGSVTVQAVHIAGLSGLGIPHAKVGVEGLESDLLPAMDLSEVQHITCEYHVNMLGDKDHVKLESLKSYLRLCGFTVRQVPEDPKKRWTVMLYADRL